MVVGTGADASWRCQSGLMPRGMFILVMKEEFNGNKSLDNYDDLMIETCLVFCMHD